MSLTVKHIQKVTFTFADVVQMLSDKMITRHPHVFGDVEVPQNGEDALALWKEVKRKEKEGR